MEYSHILTSFEKLNPFNKLDSRYNSIETCHSNKNLNTRLTNICKAGDKTEMPFQILERHVSDHLLSYLNHNDLLHKTQSGFRSQHSCETALTHMIDSWLEAVDNGQMVGLVLVDFKKAFDMVDHKILLCKLEMYGIKNEALQWFTSYLTASNQ